MSFDLIQFVKEQEPLFVGALTDQSLTWAKECQFAIQLFQRNQKLAETAISNPTSAQNAIINVAAVGISLNPASKLAYLVPRDGMVCLDISRLASSSGASASSFMLATTTRRWVSIRRQLTNTTHLLHLTIAAPLSVATALLKPLMATISLKR